MLRSLGLRVREARVRAGFSQERLASDVGIATNNISNLETGKKGLSLGTLVAIARSLGVSPGDLFDARAPLPEHPLPAPARTVLGLFEQLSTADQELAVALVRDVVRHRGAWKGGGLVGEAACGTGEADGKAGEPG